jgi:hypothetical protein
MLFMGIEPSSQSFKLKNTLLISNNKIMHTLNKFQHINLHIW